MESNAAPDFELVVAQGRRFVIFHRDVGVWLGGESIGFMRKGERLTRPFRDIAAVTLSTRGLPRIGTIANCDIQFKSGERAIVTNINGHGFPEATRSDAFRQFVTEFHRRLLEAGAKDIVFRSGYSESRSAVLLLGLIAGAVLFLGLPLALYISTGDAGTLVLLLGSLVLLLPAFRVFGPNRPTSYSPARPPDLLARSGS